MQVKHRLSCVGIAIEHGAIAAIGMSVLFCERCRDTHHFTHQAIVCGGELVEACNVASRNDQDMGRCLRSDVLECDHVLVLVNDSRRNVSGHKSAEETVTHITSSKWRRAGCSAGLSGCGQLSSPPVQTPRAPLRP